tara:strand:+ start:131 stop:466 length:336 start_codon:yes stop_codon:yes gene_type:complete
MTELRGIFAAITTPMDDAGEAIDEGRYRDHTDFLIEGGVHDLVLCSGTGEYAYLSQEERHWLIETGVKAATSLAGLPMGGHRAPLTPPSDAAMRELANAMSNRPSRGARTA